MASLLALGAIAWSRFSYDLVSNFQRYIDDFEVAWRNIGFLITPKVHLVTKHLAKKLAQNGHGSALLNKSAGECVYADFDKN